MTDSVLMVEDVQVEGCSPSGGVISVWTLNRPSKLNALNRDSHTAIKEQCVRVESEDSIRAVGIRGKSSDDVRDFFGNNAWEAVWNLSKPTIAMVDGFALGGGTELALACDIRVASSRAKFGQPEINLGLIPGGGGTQRLCRLLGYGKAMEMTLTGEMVGAEDALRLGLVNKVVEPEDLEDEAMKMADVIARKSPHTIRVAKRAVRAALDLPFSEGVLAERSEFIALFDTEDKEIGVQAFLERSDAEWVGR